MASKKSSLDSVKETIGYIDSLIESLKLSDDNEKTNLNDYIDKYDVGLNLGNPIDLLLKIAMALVPKETIQAYIVNMIMYELPAIELGVKGVLLSNLKETVDCTNDPRIPDYLRKKISCGNNTLYTVDNDHGIDINVSELDYNNIFYYSPLSKEGRNWYMGTSGVYKIWNTKKKAYKKKSDVELNDSLNAQDDVIYNTYEEALKHCTSVGDTPYCTCELTSVYELCRAKDFNAFMWFVMNKAHFRVKHRVKTNNLGDYTIPYYTVDKETEQISLTPTQVFSDGNTNNLSHFYGHYKKTKLNNKKPFSVGNGLYQNYSNIVSIVFKETQNQVAGKTQFLNNSMKLEKSFTKVNFKTTPITNASTTSTNTTTTTTENKEDTSTKTDNKKEKTRKKTTVKGDKKEEKTEKETNIAKKFTALEIVQEPNANYFVPNYQLNTDAFTVSDSVKAEIADTVQLEEVNATAKGVVPTEYTWDFVPVSSDNMSANWYVQANQFYDFLSVYSKEPEKHQHERDYDKEYGICNLRYNGNVFNTNTNYYNQSIHFSILPKPFLFNTISSPTVPRIVTFNKSGESKNPYNGGKFTIMPFNPSGLTTVTINLTSASTTTVSFKNFFDKSVPPPFYSEKKGDIGKTKEIPKLSKVYEDPTGMKSEYGNVYYYNLYFNGYNASNLSKEFWESYNEDGINPYGLTSVDGVYYPPRIYFDKNSYHYWLNTSAKSILHRVLFECYPKLTVYEFNYDFVMGMQLFDPVTVSSQLFSVLANASLSSNGEFGIHFSKTETEYQMRISEIVENLINQQSSEIADCFYNFSNDKYAQMENEAELKRSNLYGFQNSSGNSATHVDLTNVYDILNEYDQNGTKEENLEVLNRAFTQATASITEEVLPEDKYSLEKNILVECIKLLVNILVETLLSPKIMFILAVDKELVGDLKDEFEGGYSWEKLVESMIGIITSIVGELVDMIIKELWDWVKGLLLELIKKLASALVLEQAEYYVKLIKNLLKVCSFKIKGRTELDSVLDEVNYADIDENIQVQTDECD